VLHNGVAIQNRFQLQGTTAWHKPPEYKPHPDKLPISIQFHGNPVQFRNIWLRELKPIVGKTAGEKAAKETPAAVSGRITLDGQPLAGATIAFHSDGNGKTVAATTSADGSFTFDSVAPGVYTVTIRGAEKSAAEVHEKYGKPETSGMTVAAGPGKNVLDFDLRSE